MNWLSHSWPWIFELTARHLALSVPAIVLSVLIAVPLGRLAYRHPRLGGALLSAATLLYAIPALPLLIIIPALFGFSLRSPATIIVALTLYGIALMVRTAADAFNAVPAEVRQAAMAIGHSPRQTFWKVELPLAIPVLISGMRVVVVSTVGLVTIGALVGIASLGTLFTDGFQRGITASVLTGIIATVILALVLDGLVLLLGRIATPWASQHVAIKAQDTTREVSA
ncbi:Osmoprotectant transport system permease protein [Glutamicibacter creatinolyticus]|uniref:Osmoprotectant transport system permease protein n=1 Tax=Glutamicibacter creatinolyticus TaxID=162496 RepID=A0A5B7WVH6_9MICC|nr:ABC transporter permease subunit [Glutamicibacter creatinolyticus]QCY47305.1 Osmoprotectant transport system permease protein [Glutamicibacter creatinolyticus]